MYLFKSILIVLITLLVSSVVYTSVPEFINFQGWLAESDGTPVADGSYSVVFTIYDDAVSGTSKWTETQNVTTAGGLFSVKLGTNNPISDTVFNEETRYLGIAVGGDPELTPRTALLSVPYAMRVATIDGADGGSISGNIELDVSTATTGIIYKGGTPFLHDYNENLFIGKLTGNQNMIGTENISVGQFCLIDNYLGSKNTAIGASALKNNQSGFENTASGYTSLFNNSTGSSNTGYGFHSLYNNNSGQYNTALGSYADVTAGNLTNATAIGYGAQVDASNKIRLGNDDVTAIVAPAPGIKLGIGTNTPTQALDVVGTAKVDGFQMATGSGDGLVMTSDASGVGTWQPAAGGDNSGWQDDGNAVRLSTITDSVGIGTAAPQANLHVAGTMKVTGGNIELDASTSTSGNIYKGGQLFLHTSGDPYGVFIGRNAYNPSSTGGGNTAVGGDALRFNTTGYENTCLGSQSLLYNSTGMQNTAIGFLALQSNNSSYNTAMGARSLYSNTSGLFNTAIGSKALSNNMTGSGNTAVGESALKNNTSNYNTACGWKTLFSLTNGSANTAIGSNSLDGNTTGSNNTVVGAFANVTAGNLTNATAIGFFALVDASNKVRIGNADVTVIEGQVAYTFSSDRNLKENFQPVDGEEVLNKISEMNLTSWNYIGQDPESFRHYGPMAQDLYEAFGYDGVGQIGDSVSINSGDEAGILFVAVKALEQRTAEIAKVKAENATLKEELAELKKAVNDLLEQSKENKTSRVGLK